MDSQQLSDLMALREKHGFDPRKHFNVRRRSPGIGARRWGREMLTKLGSGDYSDFPAQLSGTERIGGQIVTKNALIYAAIQERFPRFAWRYESVPVQGSQGLNGQTKIMVQFSHYPTVGGFNPTLFDLLVMPTELIDQKDDRFSVPLGTEREGQQIDFGSVRQKVDATGFGYMGIEGLSWLPALSPIVYPKYLEEELLLLGDALFAFFDAIRDRYAQGDRELTSLLEHKVPSRIQKLMLGGSVDVIRPDIVIVQDGTRFRFVITELESCPGGQGMTYAMQHAYDLAPEVVESFVDYLDGRSYRVVSTHEWAEYTWDQAAFCLALRDRGVNAQMIFDKPLEAIHSRVQSRWKVPNGAPAQVKEAWNTDYLGRLAKHGFDEFVHGVTELPTYVGDSVVFRFGYFDNFSPKSLHMMRDMETNGAKVINPLQFALESKALMAAIKIESVRDYVRDSVGEGGVDVLDRCVAETRLLRDDPELLSELRGDRSYWLTKYAAWDGDNMSWGSRSLAVGTQMGPAQWERSLDERLMAPHPIVAQHTISSVRYDVAFVDGFGLVQVLADSRTRYTPFLYRGPGNKAINAGGGMTLRSNTFRVHGATDAVEAPVIFED